MPDIRTGVIDDIYTQMVSIENAWTPFDTIAALAGYTFTSVKRMPQRISAYPMAFRIPVEGQSEGYSSGGLERSDLLVKVGIMVGLSSQPWDTLGQMSEAYITEFLRCYKQNYQINGLVEAIPTIQFMETLYKPRDTEHYGVVFTMPVSVFWKLNP